MSGRRLSLAHSVAEDRGAESGAPSLSRTRGQMVTGFATFYLSGSTGWEKISPGRLDLVELLGGASGFGNNSFQLVGTALPRPSVEFYLNLRVPSKSYAAAFLPIGDIFTLGFFGRRFS